MVKKIKQYGLTVRFEIVAPEEYLQNFIRYLNDCIDSIPEILFGPVNQDKDGSKYFGGIEEVIPFDRIEPEVFYDDDKLWYLLIVFYWNREYTDAQHSEIMENLEISTDTWREGDFLEFYGEKSKKYGIPEDIKVDIKPIEVWTFNQ